MRATGGGRGPGRVRPLGRRRAEEGGRSPAARLMSRAARRGSAEQRSRSTLRMRLTPGWRWRRSVSVFASHAAARMDPRRLDDARRRRVRVRPRRRHPRAYGTCTCRRATPIVTVILITAPLAFLVGIGGFDYWGKWIIGAPTEARGPLRPRRPQLARLLPRQHRPQGDRRPVHGHRAFLPVRRRGAGRGHPRRACSAGPAGLRSEHLQRPLLGPRRTDDLPGRDPDLRGPRELRASRS